MELASVPRPMAGVPVALALLTIGVGEARAAFPGANGRIAFTVQQWRESQDPRVDPEFVAARIDTVRPNGRARRVLLTSPAGQGCCGDSGPVWSPDGRRLAFDFGGRLAILRHTGRGLRQLPQLTQAEAAPAWSPDGRRLVFNGVVEGDFPRLYTVRSDGTGLRRVTDEWATSPAWSSRGTIAFVNDDEPGWRQDGLHTIRPNGSGMRRLFGRYWGTGAQPDWSPSGRRLAFGARQHIFTIRADGRGLRRLTDRASSGNSNPAWSPDGRYVAFLRSGIEYSSDITLRRTGLYVVRANGRGLRRVLETTDAGPEYEFLGPPSWQPLAR